MTQTYEVEHWDEKIIPESPRRVVFKHKQDMINARRDIMNDKDIIFEITVKGKKIACHIPYTLLKQGLYDGDIIFEAGDI